MEYLQENGYETIVMSDLICYVEYGTPLPENPIILAFDDGYYNNYLYAYTLLKEYHMKAVFSIIGRYTDEYSLEYESHAVYSHLTWNQINEMIGWMPNTFTYPFGYVSKNSFEILKDMGFKATLGCQEGVSQISRDPECLFLLSRCLRSP